MEAATSWAGPAVAPGPLPRVPGFDVLGVLGRGGAGVVYRAVRLGLNRPCALKMLREGPGGDAAAAVRLLAEAETVARLRHPHVVQIYSLGEHEGRAFLELEFAEGGSLARRLDGTPWPPADAARLVEAVAARRRGVAPAGGHPPRPQALERPAGRRWHAQGRRLRPGARLGSGSTLTESGAILGTPSYMAPEQAAGDRAAVGPAADVYALGAIFYELLTGRPPFKAPTILETVEQVRSVEAVPPSRLVPGVLRDAETIVMTCLRKEPARRYPLGRRPGRRPAAVRRRRADRGPARDLPQRLAKLCGGAPG